MANFSGLRREQTVPPSLPRLNRSKSIFVKESQDVKRNANWCSTVHRQIRRGEPQSTEEGISPGQDEEQR